MNTSSLTTASNWLEYSTKRLKSAGIKTARLDSLILLETITKVPRVKILSDGSSISLKESYIEKLETSLKRRESFEPIAYITNDIEFYGRTFYVNNHVLVPRPESESFLEILKKLPIKNNSKLADVGCGSGVLGISAKIMFPFLDVDLIDVSDDAIKVTGTNLDKLAVKARCLQGDLLENNDADYKIVLANLPYVPDDFKINDDAKHEPKVAIFGGQDGLDLYRKLFMQISNRAHKPDYLLLESLLNQHSSLENLALVNSYRLQETDGLVQCFSV